MRAKTFDGWTLEQESIRCGKKGCRTCPHGPYWYGYRSESGKTRKKYFGRHDPREPKKAKQPEPKRAAPTSQPPTEPRGIPVEWEAIFGRRTGSAALARQILGILSEQPTRQSLDHAYKRESMQNHPDRGGSVAHMSAINCAYAYLDALVK